MLVVVLRATLQNKYLNESKVSPVTLRGKKEKKNMNSNSVKPIYAWLLLCYLFSPHDLGNLTKKVQNSIYFEQSV